MPDTVPDHDATHDESRGPMADTSTSSALFDRAQPVIPGGVNSPVRAFDSVGGTPRFMRRGEGADTRGRRRQQLPRPRQLVGAAAVRARPARGARRGGGRPRARLVLRRARPRARSSWPSAIVEAVPSVEKVRLVNSGHRGRHERHPAGPWRDRPRKLLKFVGHYHGHADALLVAAGSGVATLGIPGSPGVTEGAAADTVLVPWNDREAVAAAVDRARGRPRRDPVRAGPGQHEPGRARGGVPRVPARARPTAAAPCWCSTRSSPGSASPAGGAQEVHGVTPDLTVLGKVVGGGFPLAAFGGRADLMDHLAPAGPVYQAGTLSGNPVAVAAGLAQLDLLTDEVYAGLRAMTDRLVAGLRDAFADDRRRRPGAPARHPRRHPVRRRRRRAATRTSRPPTTPRYARFFHAMLDRGVYLAPSGLRGAVHLGGPRWRPARPRAVRSPRRGRLDGLRRVLTPRGSRSRFFGGPRPLVPCRHLRCTATRRRPRPPSEGPR